MLASFQRRLVIWKAILPISQSSSYLVLRPQMQHRYDDLNEQLLLPEVGQAHAEAVVEAYAALRRGAAQCGEARRV